jgi:dTDP-glucose pyrophosphorylase
VRKFQKGCHRVKPVAALTEGTASTVLLARPVFDNDQPMMVANSDQLVDFDVNAYIDDCFSRRLDGSILVFRDPEMDPKWSFVKLDKDGLVTEVAEKKPISDLATVGIYFFSKGSDFISAAIDMIVANDRVNDEFYTCPVYNYMIKNGARIGDSTSDYRTIINRDASIS